MSWIKDILDDEIELCGLLAMLGLLCLAFWNHGSTSVRDFAESAAIVLGAIGGSKWARDGRSKPGGQ